MWLLRWRPEDKERQLFAQLEESRGWPDNMENS